MENPLGFGTERPVVSWVADSERSKRQKKARIRLAKDTGMEEIIYNSEEGGSDTRNPCSLGTELPVKLEPETGYDWTVQADPSARAAVMPLWKNPRADSTEYSPVTG